MGKARPDGYFQEKMHEGLGVIGWRLVSTASSHDGRPQAANGEPAHAAIDQWEAPVHAMLPTNSYHA